MTTCRHGGLVVWEGRTVDCVACRGRVRLKVLRCGVCGAWFTRGRGTRYQVDSLPVAAAKVQ